MVPKDKVSGVWEYDERYQCYNNKKYLSKFNLLKNLFKW